MLLRDDPSNNFLRTYVIEGKIIVIIMNYHYWINNEEKLLEFLEFHKIKQIGMTLEFESEEQLAWFTLRWGR